MSILELKDVCYSYSAEKPVLRGMNCTFECGTLYALVGKSGAGKSTLLSLMAGLDLPDSGQVLFEGTSTGDMDLDEYRRRKAAVIYQDFALFPLLTAEENVCYPLRLRKEDKDQALALARQRLADMGIRESYFRKLPNQLSGGEQQRVAIARMLMQQAPIMVFDDSLSAVDAETDAKIRTALRDTLHSATVLLISHRVTTLMQADRILVLDGGRVSALGTHRELIQQPGIYRDIYDIQMRSDDRALVEEGGNA